MKTLFVLLLSIIGLSATSKDYYISNSGNDSNSGTEVSSPWQTLNKLNSFKDLSPGDNVYFKRGDSFVGSITVNQSGTSGNPITFGAYGTGANPIITGFVTIDSWRNLGNNIWQSTNAVSARPNCNVVTINGVNTPMGRYPNAGFLTYQNSSSTSLTSSSLNASVNNWTGAQAVIKKERYIIDRNTITKASGNTINFTNSSWAVGHPDWGFFIQNDIRTLDQPNEWYYNGSDKKLTVYSLSEPKNVKLATRDTLAYVVSKTYITFTGLSFTGSNGQAFYLGNVSNLKIQNCEFSFNYNGISGKQFGGSSSNLLIDHCLFNQTSNNGIELPPEFAGAIITNNVIKNTGMIEGLAGSGQSRWGISLTGNNYIVQYNKVDSTGYVAIGLNGSHLICKNNFVNYFCSITDDGGGIYTGNRQLGVVIADNIVLNGIGNDEGTNSTNNGQAYGIYCNGLSSGMTILNNSIANIIHAGIFLHEANHIIVNGNTTYNCRMGLFASADIASVITEGLDVKNNVFVAKTVGAMYSPQNQVAVWLATYHDDLNRFGRGDSNYFARPIDDSLTIMGTQYGVKDYAYTLSDWQAKYGFDLHSSKSPKTITNINDLRFEYNASSSSKTISLDANYIDMANKSYNGSVTLAPYTSVALIKNGEIIRDTLLPAVNPSNTVNGLDYDYYESGSYNSVPAFDGLAALKTGTSDNFEISQSNRSTAFSFNFTGYIDVASDGQYTFFTTSDDGSNLYIDGILVVNNDAIQSATEKSGVIGLKAGKHAISVGYFQQNGDKILLASYSGPGVIKQNIPNSSLYRVSDSSLLPAVDPSNTVNGLDYRYYEASSYNALPAFNELTPEKTGISDNFDISQSNRSTAFSFNFTGYIDVPSDGQYTFYITSDDGSNLYIDNVLVVNNDGIQTTTERSGVVGLQAGKHTISIGYFQQNGDKILLASYSGPGVSKQNIPNSSLYRISASSLLPAVDPSNTVNGLDYKYYESGSYNSVPTFDGLTAVKSGTTYNFDISLANRDTAYSFNFEGYIEVPSDGQYTFYTTSDNGSNLYIDNILVVNNDGIQVTTERFGVIGLQAGKHAISIGYFQQNGDNILSVSYSGTDVSKQNIPNSSLYRDSTNSLLPAVNPSNTVNGVEYKYYEASRYSAVPSFSGLSPVKTGTADNFDISSSNRSTPFAFNFTGYIDVPKDGQYTFYTTSDDGSKLYIDSVLVVNNDGIQRAIERSGVIGLKAGKHAISVGYFQQNGYKILLVGYSGPGVSKKYIPASSLYRLSKSGLLPALNPSNVVNGLDYKYFEASSYSSLPSFNGLTPVKSGTSNNFDVSLANRSNAFSFNFAGYVDIPVDGQYTFYTNSDDGSNLYIDNILVVDNDGLHSARERFGVIGLEAGKHAISVDYFQQGWDNTLSVSYEGPVTSKKTIPEKYLYRIQGTAFQRSMNNLSTPDVKSNGNNSVNADELINSLNHILLIKADPNPFSSIINVTISGFSKSNFQLTLLNALGQEVWTKNVENVSGFYTEVINTSGLTKGGYFLRFVQDNKSHVLKLLKQY